jgi:hypothetical protein
MIVSEDGTRYSLRMIKGAQMEGGKLIVTFYGLAFTMKIAEPEEKDIKTFVPEQLVIMAVREFDIVALMEARIGYAKVDAQYGERAGDGTLKIKIEPAN